MVKMKITLSNVTESFIQIFAAEWFDWLGYDYVYAPDIAPDSYTLLPKLMSGEVRVNT